MSGMKTFIILSFAVLQSGRYITSKGNQTIATVNGPEKYEIMETSFSSVVKSINELIKRRMVMIEGNEVPLQVFLGAGLKSLLKLMGLSGATSTGDLLWCKAPKDNRCDMTKTLAFYNSSQMKRTLQSIKTCSVYSSSQNNYCCIHLPLFEIELDYPG